MMRLSGVYFITDKTYCRLSAVEMTRAVLDAGVRIVQYREKNASRRRIYEEAVALRELTVSYGALLIINDHADIALAVGADGVHLGQDDLPLAETRRLMGGRIIGISTHSIGEAEAAAAGGADYIGYGPVFHTTTKDAGRPQGVDNLRVITHNVSVPVVAIGGIDNTSIESVFDAGAAAAAVATAICRGDVFENAKRLVGLLHTKGVLQQFCA
jgi:thiamine-phosphate pyrophosphorylase